VPAYSGWPGLKDIKWVCPFVPMNSISQCILTKQSHAQWMSDQTVSSCIASFWNANLAMFNDICRDSCSFPAVNQTSLTCYLGIYTAKLLLCSRSPTCGHIQHWNWTHMKAFCKHKCLHVTKHTKLSYSCISAGVALWNEIFAEAWNNASITFGSNHAATSSKK